MLASNAYLLWRLWTKCGPPLAYPLVIINNIINNDAGLRNDTRDTLPDRNTSGLEATFTSSIISKPVAQQYETMQQAAEQASLEYVKLVSGPEAAAMWIRYRAVWAAVWKRDTHACRSLEGLPCGSGPSTVHYAATHPWSTEQAVYECCDPFLVLDVGGSTAVSSITSPPHGLMLMVTLRMW